MPVPLILWVEDNPLDVDMVQQAFVESGLMVEFILPDNAVLAFHYMASRPPFERARRPPDLILLDLNLPVMSGMVVLREARSHPPWHAIPIVVFTSSANSAELNTCLRQGASECITKPSTFDGFLAVVERLRAYLPDASPCASAAMPCSP